MKLRWKKLSALLLAVSLTMADGSAVYMAQAAEEQTETTSAENSGQDVVNMEPVKNSEQEETEPEVTVTPTPVPEETAEAAETPAPEESVTPTPEEQKENKDTENEPAKAETTPVAEKAETAKTQEAETISADEAAWASVLAAGGNNNAGGSSVAETSRFVPGTYTITANLYVPAELNSILGLNAYLTNPDNPAGVVEDNGSISNTAPTTPVSANAMITIGEDGTTKTLTIPVKNPVFTLQRIGNGSNVTILDSARNGNTYGQYNGRITSLTVALGDNSGAYVFTDCLEYPTILDQDWNVPLYLAVDLASLPSNTTVKMNSGDGSKWKEGSGDSLSFIAEQTYDQMEGVQVDGTAVKSGNYSAFAYNGMTYVDLNADYLGTLKAGAHKISILFAGGFSANASFTIEKKETEKSDDKNKDTGEKLKAGTYKVTANLYIPGELNKQLPGTTAYMTNPKNPLGIGGHEGLPTDPVKDNATLVVDKKGGKTVIVDVVNPVFTLQKITDGKKIKVLSAVWDKETYTGTAGRVSRTGRITKLYLKLEDNSGVYQFGDCTEFPTLLEEDWNVPLQLGVDFTSAKKTSDSTETKLPENGTSGDKNPSGDKKQGTNKNDNKGNSNGSGGNANADSNQNGKLKAGTYTVAANIWIDKSAAGLPLSPHLTNSEFPPKDPVSNNATLTVDENSNARVSVPIVIPSKVMYVESISGLNIVDSSTGGNGLSSITVDLGTVTDPNAVITKSCTVSLQLGELAQSIAKKERDQVWAATFQVSLSGVPSAASGGGSSDVNALMAGAASENADTKSVEVKVGVLPGTSALFVTDMMQKAKEKNSVKTSYNYTFKVEELKEKEKDSGKKLSEKQKEKQAKKEMKKLEKQLTKHFDDGDYDMVICPADVAATIWKEKDAKKNLRILSVTKTWIKSDEDSEDKKSGETELSVTLVTKKFADAQKDTLKDYLTEISKSADMTSKDQGELAEDAKGLGLYEDAEDAEADLDVRTYGISSGKDMQQVLKESLKKKQLPDEELYYIPESQKKASDESTKEKDSKKDTDTKDTEKTKDTSKTDYTDQAALSSAIEAALADKKGSSEDEGTDAKEEKTDSSSTDSTENSSVKTDGTGAVVIDPEESEAAAKELEAGTYTVSANMYLPGELNTQLPGTTAYMTNPDNPLGVGGHEGIPMTPVDDNATLVVGEDGTKTVMIEVVNPVFTLQDIKDPENSEILSGVKDDEWYAGTNDVGRQGRITTLYIRLGDDSGTYSYDTCTEFPTLLEEEWNVPLKMSVDFTTAKKTSEETSLEIPDDNAGVASETENTETKETGKEES
ncbi:hypothetical protein DXC87_16540 [Blautia obeum]|uniref:hypothetical protein n=1 Tax=Blautia obeum TaxID=40520 RepID=UPI000E447BA3|nr:hypothetical protein [Blautia obeum]RGK89303.1 hypothetical protein DXC87_16540 [Blautia obeum]